MVFNSTELFVAGSSGVEAEQAARIGTWLLGVTSVLGSTTTLYISKYISIRALMLIGEAVMIVTYISLCLFAINRCIIGEILATNVFVFTFS